jgi:hypothetical protein
MAKQVTRFGEKLEMELGYRMAEKGTFRQYSAEGFTRDREFGHGGASGSGSSLPSSWQATTRHDPPRSHRDGAFSAMKSLSWNSSIGYSACRENAYLR